LTLVKNALRFLVSAVPILCQLYLLTETHQGAIQQLAAALDAAPVAAVLVRSTPDATIDATVARSLVELVQARGVAALIEGDADLAQTIKADGVHLPYGEDIAQRFANTREMLGSGGMIGVDAGGSRHAAMEMAEAGADYVAFGTTESDAEFNKDELLAWWSEIFQVPCVAFDVADAAAAEALARTGVDFVGVTLTRASSAAESAAVVASFARAVDVPATV
jgi:thiamine-phosphate pyrophosphorylase